MNDTIDCPACYASSPNDITIFLIEIDSDQTDETIKKLIQSYYPILIHAYEQRDYSRIEQLLNDDDILGIKTLSKFGKNIPVSIEFNDIYRMDRYKYTIQIN